MLVPGLLRTRLGAAPSGMKCARLIAGAPRKEPCESLMAEAEPGSLLEYPGDTLPPDVRLPVCFKGSGLPVRDRT